MPSAAATASRPWIARQARPVRERKRFNAKRIVPADAASSTKYHARGSCSVQPKITGGSITTPVEKPRLVSYSPPR